MITKIRRLVARFAPHRRQPRSRVPGAWRGRVNTATDFDELPPEVAAPFRGEKL